MTELPLDVAGWSADEIRRVGYRTVDLIADYLTQLPNGPVFRPVPRPVADEFLEIPAPERGSTPDQILDDFARTIAPYPFGNGHPRFYGWVNSPPALMGIFAEALAAAMNPSVAGGNHASVYIEHEVLNWFKEIAGFPASSMGLLVSGGSVAALTALAVARYAASRARGWDVRKDGAQIGGSRLMVYQSAEAHGCNQKAVELLGLGSDSIRVIECDGARRMVASSLDRAIRNDLSSGLVPMAVVASAGTVNTGAIDPLAGIADICSNHQVWLHVDGAYGAAARLTDSYRETLRDLNRADSLAVDPHKWFYVPLEAGLVLIKDAQAMREAFSLVPPYLRTDGNVEGVQGPPWFSEYGIQQSRGFRALKVWMALKQLGVDGYRRSIERDIALARHLTGLVRESSELEGLEPQSLSIVCFRYVPQRTREANLLNDLNRAILSRVQLGGQAFVSGTVLDDCFWLRACIVNPLARPNDLEILVAAVIQAGRELSSVEVSN
jgi:glutamate/tyrosine decarboxylase-like PLP-dependent enzyme